jgi:streptogramin lyase
VWLRRGLDDFEPRDVVPQQVAAVSERRRRRRRGGFAAVAVAVAAAIVFAVALTPSDHPLSPPTVSASVQLTMPGRVLDSASGDGALWVLTCETSCDNAAEPGAGRGDLVKVNSAGGSIESTTPVADPHSLAVGEGGVWVVSMFSDTVSRFDPATGELVASIPLALPTPIGTGAEATRFLPFTAIAGAGSVWVGTDRGYVAEIDPRSNEIVRTIKTSAPADDLAVAGDSVAVAANLDGVLTIDATSGAVSGPAPIEDASGRRLSVSELFEAEGSLWAEGAWAQATGEESGGNYVGTDEKGVVELDPRSGQIEHVATVPARLSVRAVSRSRIWLSDWSSRMVYELNSPRTGAVLVARLKAHGMIVGSVGNAVWLAEPHRTIASYELPRKSHARGA